MGPTVVESIAQEAERLINGDRREAYGPVSESFERIAQIWSGVLGQKVSATQVAHCMIGLKLYREANKHQRDNLVDICGYSLLAEKLNAAIPS